MSTRYCTLVVIYPFWHYLALPGLDSQIEMALGLQFGEAGSDFANREITFFFGTLSARQAAITKLQASPLTAQFCISWFNGMPGRW